MTFGAQRALSASPTLNGRVDARTGREWLVPIAWVVTLTGAFAIPFSTITWPFGDTYTVFYKAYSLGWHDAVVDAFARDIEYRPFFTLLVKFLYRIVGLRLWFYKAIVLAQFALILLLFIRLLRPEGSKRVLASVLAISVVAGLHTSQILFSFFPVNHHSLVIMLVLVAATLALDPPMANVEWPIALVTLCGLLFIEFGLIIPPMLVALYVARARGATRRAVIGSWLAFAVYAIVRLTFGTQDGLPLVHNDTGLGFARISPDETLQIFGHAHWLFFVYNIVATFLTVVASEPRSGRFHFIETQLHGNTPVWLWIHVVSSLATTAFIVWRLTRRGAIAGRDRQLAALAVALIVIGSGLGFLYARDRIGLPVGLGYAILLYLAAATTLERSTSGSRTRVAVGGVIALLLIAWVVRDAEMWFFLRDAAWDRHREWTDRYEELGGYTRPQTDLLEHLRTVARGTAIDDPRQDPRWTYVLFERQYGN